MSLAPVITVVAIVAFLVGTQWIVYRLTNGRTWSAQWMAFSFTAGGALFLITGAIGYKLDKYTRLLDPKGWQDGVIWLQVAIGGVMLVVATVCWIVALRSYRVPRTIGQS